MSLLLVVFRLTRQGQGRDECQGADQPETPWPECIPHASPVKGNGAIGYAMPRFVQNDVNTLTERKNNVKHVWLFFPFQSPKDSANPRFVLFSPGSQTTKTLRSDLLLRFFPGSKGQSGLDHKRKVWKHEVRSWNGEEVVSKKKGVLCPEGKWVNWAWFHNS